MTDVVPADILAFTDIVPVLTSILARGGVIHTISGLCNHRIDRDQLRPLLPGKMTLLHSDHIHPPAPGFRKVVTPSCQ